MHTAQLSSQPTLLMEEDKESGIGSTHDLTSNFEGYSVHTNHTPSLKDADRLPTEKGTRKAFKRRVTISSLYVADSLISLKR